MEKVFHQQLDNLEQVNARNWKHNIIPVLIFLLCISFPDELKRAKEYAEKARKICEKLKVDGKNEYWVQATEAEALLLLGSVKDSVVSYVKRFHCRDANHLGFQVRGSRHYRLQGNMKMNKFLKKSKTHFQLLVLLLFRACFGSDLDPIQDFHLKPRE